MLVAEVGQHVYYATAMDGGGVDADAGVEEDNEAQDETFEEGVGRGTT